MPPLSVICSEKGHNEMALTDWDKKHLSSGQQRALVEYTAQYEGTNRYDSFLV